MFHRFTRNAWSEVFQCFTRCVEAPAGCFSRRSVRHRRETGKPLTGHRNPAVFHRFMHRAGSPVFHRFSRAGGGAFHRFIDLCAPPSGPERSGKGPALAPARLRPGGAIEPTDAGPCGTGVCNRHRWRRRIVVHVSIGRPKAAIGKHESVARGVHRAPFAAPAYCSCVGGLVGACSPSLTALRSSGSSRARSNRAPSPRHAVTDARSGFDIGRRFRGLWRDRAAYP